MTRMVIWKARFPRVRYACRARPGPPEKATKTTPRPTRIHGMRKIQTFIRRGILDDRVRIDVPLGAGQAEEEAHVEDVALALVEFLEALPQELPLLGKLVALIVVAEVLERITALLLAVVGAGGRQGHGVVGPRGVERLHHLLGGGFGGGCELLHAWRA